MNRHTFHVRYNYPDLLGATWMTVRERWRWRGVAKYLAGVSLIMFAILEFAEDRHTLTVVLANGAVSLLISVTCLACTFLWWLWCVPRNVRKSYDQLALEGGTAEFSYDDAFLEITDPANTLKLPWKKWLKWAENDQFLLLYRTDHFAHYVPKAQVDPKFINDIKRYLKNAGIPRS